MEVEVVFTTANVVNAGGTVEIVFPATFPTVYAHCRSAVSSGSLMYSIAGNNIPYIGCQVQNSRNWVITGFQQLAASTLVKIQGWVDLPTTATTTASLEIHTYSDMHLTNVNANGQRIDKVTAGITVTTIADKRMSIDLDAFSIV